MNFVVIAAKRTGSSHFVNLLSAHPEVFCHGNVFKDNMKFAPILWPASAHPGDKLEHKYRKEFAELRDTDIEAYLKKVFETGYGRPHVGFKIFWNQNNAMLERMLLDPSIRKIVLYRTNVLANYASTRQAMDGGGWGTIEGKESSSQPTEFNTKHFFSFHDAYTGFYKSIFEKLNASGQDYHFIQYDQINNPIMLSAVIKFIGGDVRRPPDHDEAPRRQVKEGSTDILSRFSNPKRVKKILERFNLQHWSYEEELMFKPLGDGTGEDVFTDEIAG